MATLSSRAPRETSRARYRMRTWLRGALPLFLQPLAPKGSHDCGAHEFHNVDDVVDRCYHCTVGERVHVDAPLSPEARMMLERAEQAGVAVAGRVLLRHPE